MRCLKALAISSGVKPHLSITNCVATPPSRVMEGLAICVQILENLKWGFAVSVGERRREMASENGALFFVNRLHII